MKTVDITKNLHYLDINMVHGKKRNWYKRKII